MILMWIYAAKAKARDSATKTGDLNAASGDLFARVGWKMGMNIH